jgi:hypothetical protein
MRCVPKDRLSGDLVRGMIDPIEAGVNQRSIPGLHDIPARLEIAMRLELDSPRIPLVAHGLARLPDASSTRIVCETGTVWITIDNDPRDIVLAPGQSFLVDRRAGVLVYALEDACVRVLEQAARAAASPRARAAAARPFARVPAEVA